MSITAMTWVWNHSSHKQGALLVMLAIADHAHDDGDGSFPSIDTLAHKARLSRRQVQTTLARLESSGELEIAKGAGPKGTNVYKVVMQWPLDVTAEVRKLHPVETAPLQIQEGGAETSPSSSFTVKPTAPKPSLVTNVDDDGEITIPQFLSILLSKFAPDPHGDTLLIAWAEDHNPRMLRETAYAFVLSWEDYQKRRKYKGSWRAGFQNWVRRGERTQNNGPIIEQPASSEDPIIHGEKGNCHCGGFSCQRCHDANVEAWGECPDGKRDYCILCRKAEAEVAYGAG